MADLYTSLVHAKMALSGRLPAMTPLTGAALEVLDPSFVPGLGAFMEEPQRGLRCPVRGCGEWFHSLTKHLNARHRDVGGAAAVKRLLSVPRRASLVSLSLRETLKEREAVLRRDGKRSPSASVAAMRRGRRVPREAESMMVRNIKRTCEEQVRRALVDLQVWLGRTPTHQEAENHIGPGRVRRIIDLYGTWNNALAQQGMDTHLKGRWRWKRDEVLEALWAYYTVHGSLPTNKAQRRGAVPLLPHNNAVVRELGAETWPAAMRIAASELGIHGGRYGLPERRVA